MIIPVRPHDPGSGLWLPPAILVVLVVAIGVAPFLAEPLVKLVTSAVLGDAAGGSQGASEDLARA